MVTDLVAFTDNSESCLLSKISRASSVEQLKRILCEFNQFRTLNQVYCALIDKRKLEVLLDFEINCTDNKRIFIAEILEGIKHIRNDDDAFETFFHNHDIVVYSYGLSLNYSRTACALALPRHLTQQENSTTLIRSLIPYCFSALNNIIYLRSMQPELSLSKRELEVMEWMFHGKTNKEIGLILNVSHFTVKNHVAKIFEKLMVTNRGQAVEKAIRSNLLDIEYFEH